MQMASFVWLICNGNKLINLIILITMYFSFKNYSKLAGGCLALPVRWNPHPQIKTSFLSIKIVGSVRVTKKKNEPRWPGSNVKCGRRGKRQKSDMQTLLLTRPWVLMLQNKRFKHRFNLRRVCDLWKITPPPSF